MSYENTEAFLLTLEDHGTRQYFSNRVAKHVEKYGEPFKKLLDLYARDSAETFQALIRVLGERPVVQLVHRYRYCRWVVLTGITHVDWLEMLFALGDLLTEDAFRQLGVI